jgi:hypothetical protein
MNAMSTRRELKAYIDAIPEHSFSLARNFLMYLVNTQPVDKPLAIETNLTEAEKENIAEGRRERKEHPENFTSWTDVKKEIGLA